MFVAGNLSVLNTKTILSYNNGFLFIHETFVKSEAKYILAFSLKPLKRDGTHSYNKVDIKWGILFTLLARTISCENSNNLLTT